MNPSDLLRALIKDRYAGNQAAFARAIGRSASQVNQWLSGHRKLDLKGSRIMEEKLGLPPGYFQGAVMLCEPLPPPYVHPNETTRKIIALLEATDEAGRGVALHAVMQALREYRPDKAKAA